jgi:Straboviridae dCMP hydroxymethylase
VRDNNHIRAALAEKVGNKDFVTDKTGVKTVELIGESFLVTDDHIFGKPNQDYIERELAWYLSESLYVDDIPGGPPSIWKSVASHDGKINSNYGWAIFSEENGHQLSNVRHELTKNPFSRRAIAIYTRPSMWLDYNKGGMSDFMCTNSVHYLIRNDKLHAIVQMRSNDAVFGFKNDYSWQEYVLNQLASELSVQPGDIFWQANSLHVYERHFPIVQHYIDTGETFRG